MDVPFKLLANNVWAAEDDKTGFLSVGADIFYRLYLKERPIIWKHKYSLPAGGNYFVLCNSTVAIYS